MSFPRLRCLVPFLALVSCVWAQGLPPVPVPPENPMSAEKVTLGKMLFFEEQLSQDNTVSCGTCHQPESGGGDPRTASPFSVNPGPDFLYGTADDIQGSISVVRCDPSGRFFDDGTFWPNPLVIKRKSQGFIGHQWDPEMFWDGRGDGVFRSTSGQVVIAAGGALENQATLVPPSGTMGCQSRTWPHIEQKLTTARPMRLASNLPSDIQAALANHPTYPSLFSWVFGDPAVTKTRVGFALAAYERSLVPDQTPYDTFIAGQTSALTPAQQNGRVVFLTSGCAQCHTPPLFTNHGFRNIGVRPPSEDMGRTIATGLFSDRGKFKVSTVRNAALRAPYFHNGRTATLEDVILFYERGGDFQENIDPAMVPFTLTPQDRADLIDFIANGLTDPRVAQALPPFDRPTLNSELPANPALFGVGAPGSGNFIPKMVAPGPPMLGSTHFTIGVAHAYGGQLGYLALAAAAAPAGTFIGPLPILIAPDPIPLLFPVNIQGPAIPGAGYASINTTIADNPGLAGASFYAQWLLFDPFAPVGLTVSDAARLTFFAP